jgi:UDP-N-acetyl-D-glucosamine dehydrogenase
MQSVSFKALMARIECQSARVGIIGLGYVGLPLAVTVARRGFPVTGFDIDLDKIVKLEAGQSYIEAVSGVELASLSEKLQWTADFACLAEMDVIVVCVPTPLTAHRDPDLSYVITTAQEIARRVTSETLVILESTTYPGTTSEVLTPILTASGMRLGEDIFIGFSPEREDPGNASFRTATIPKVVAGDGPEARQLVEAFYGRVVERIVPVSSSATAEAVKITENIFRSVNIALVNELKVIYEAMGIDIWEVIDAAATKPFGFMPFYPGPGLGGHCIPIDPFYLTWKAREFDLPTRFIELAGEINQHMPNHVVARLREVLDRKQGIGLSRARVLILGVAYKKNVSDMRESPAMRLMALLQEAGATVAFHDPHVPEIPRMREYPQFLGKQSLPMAEVRAADFDALLIATDHDAIDYAALVGLGLPIIDTRNAMARRGLSMENVTKA